MNREVVIRWLLALIIHSVALHAGFYLEPSPLPMDKLSPANGTSSELRQGPATRVLLNIIGGLRADSLLSRVNTNFFLSDVVKRRGTWGISFGETPAPNAEGMLVISTGIPDGRLAKGADNIFRHCSSIYIGPPSPIASFQEDFKYQWTYPKEWEDPKLSPNQTKADEWIFNKWVALWRDPGLGKSLRAEKVLFVIYIDGLDTACHLESVNSYRADMETNYILKEIEKGIKQMDRYFSDRNTAYIITSDHGFGEGKRHDGGSDNETMTPLIAWGAGVSDAMEGRSGTPSAWGLDGIQRRDIDQKDLASFIATLLGVTIPSMSFGNIPMSYIKNIDIKAKAAYSNAFHLTQLYERVLKYHGKRTASFLAPFSVESAKSLLEAAEKANRNEDYSKAISLCQAVSEGALAGIDYCRWYDARIVAICIGISFIGWTCVCLGWILQKLKVTPVLQRELPPRNEEEESKSGERNLFKKYIALPKLLDFAAAVIFGSTLIILFLDKAPIRLFPSILLCIMVSWLVMRHIFQWIKLYKSFVTIEVHIPLSKPLMHGLYFLLYTYFLGNSFVLHAMFAFGLIFTCLTDLRHSTSLQLACWLLSSIPYLLLLHHNPLPPRPELLIHSAIIWITLASAIIRSFRANYFDWPLFIAAILSLILITFFAQFGSSTSSKYFLLIWFPISLIIFVPLIGSMSLPIRFAQIALSISIPVFLLSVSNESFSFLFILGHFLSWYQLEGYDSFTNFYKAKINMPLRNTPIDWNHVRRSIYFIAYLLTSFRAMGTPVEPKMWEEAWPSYFSSSTSLIYLFIIFKFIPVALALTILFTALGRTSPVGTQTSTFFFLSLISLLHLVLFSNSVSSHYIFIQICSLLYLILQPCAYILQCSSLFHVITTPINPHSGDIPLQPLPKPVGQS